MKKIRTIFSLLSLSLLAISCGLDNYDEPESFLEGKITYKGKQLGLKGTNGGIQLQLYQDGYANHDLSPCMPHRTELSLQYFSMVRTNW